LIVKGGVVTQKYWNTAIVDRILVVSVTIARLLSIDPSKNPPNTRARTHARTHIHKSEVFLFFHKAFMLQKRVNLQLLEAAIPGQSRSKIEAHSSNLLSE
jgi:hypothetical protein